MMFEDRMDAGEQLAQKIKEEGLQPDVVLVTSRRGIPVADRLAREFEIPVDMILAGKISAPGEPRMPIGAVANDRTLWLKDRLVDELMVTDRYLTEAIEQELKSVRERLRKYRGKADRPRLKGKNVIVTDDGISSGLRMSACIGQVIKSAPENINLATPVISSYANDKLQPLVDNTVALERRRFLDSVDSCYGILGSQEELQIQDQFASTTNI